MSEISVEGYLVRVEAQPEGGFVASVPELPGCSVQVEKEEEVQSEIRGAIRAYLLELSEKRPRKPAREAQGAGSEPEKARPRR